MQHACGLAGWLAPWLTLVVSCPWPCARACLAAWLRYSRPQNACPARRPPPAAHPPAEMYRRTPTGLAPEIVHFSDRAGEPALPTPLLCIGAKGSNKGGPQDVARAAAASFRPGACREEERPPLPPWNPKKAAPACPPLMSILPCANVCLTLPACRFSSLSCLTALFSAPRLHTRLPQMSRTTPNTT